MSIVLEASGVTVEAMEALGGRLAKITRSGDVIGLSGELGAGKSVLARAFITHALASKGLSADEIPSPSFTLVQPYPFPSDDDKERMLWHIDLWRLNRPDEIYELGFEEALGRHVVIIEWAERIKDLLPATSLMVTIERESEDKRKVSLSCNPDFKSDWQKRLSV